MTSRVQLELDSTCWTAWYLLIITNLSPVVMNSDVRWWDNGFKRGASHYKKQNLSSLIRKCNDNHRVKYDERTPLIVSCLVRQRSRWIWEERKETKKEEISTKVTPFGLVMIVRQLQATPYRLHLERHLTASVELIQSAQGRANFLRCIMTLQGVTWFTQIKSFI